MSDLDISGENGFLENAQFLILVLAGVILIRGAIYLARNRDTSQLAYCLVLLVMPIVGAGRELSFGREINFTPDMVFACEVTLGIICLFLLISGFILFCAAQSLNCLSCGATSAIDPVSAFVSPFWCSRRLTSLKVEALVSPEANWPRRFWKSSHFATS